VRKIREALNLEYCASKLFPLFGPNTIEEFTWTETETPQCWDTLTQRALDWNPRTHALVITGPAGCGKTSWAKQHAPKPTLFVRHLDSLNLLQTHHQSIIFDDLSYQHLTPATQKYLVDLTDIAEIHLRYRVAKIPPRLTRIFTANEFPFLSTGIHADAIARRIKEINLF